MFLENICLRASNPCQNTMLFIIPQGCNFSPDWGCTWTLEVESTTHFFLHCHYYKNICKTLLDDLKVINVNILKLSGTAMANLLLYGEASFDKIQNKMILTASIKFIVDSDRFTGSIF